MCENKKNIFPNYRNKGKHKSFGNYLEYSEINWMQSKRFRIIENF